MDTNGGWTSAPQQEPAKGSPEWIAQRDSLIAQWEASKLALEKAKEDEMKLRKEVVAFTFNHDKLEGTERTELHNGYQLKAVKKLNYTLKSYDESVPMVDAVDIALTKLEALGPEGKFVADRLVKWSADLSLSEYRKLDEMPNGAAYKAIIDTVIETKEAAPTLEIVAPKGTKK